MIALKRVELPAAGGAWRGEFSEPVLWIEHDGAERWSLVREWWSLAIARPDDAGLHAVLGGAARLWQEEEARRAADERAFETARRSAEASERAKRAADMARCSGHTARRESAQYGFAACVAVHPFTECNGRSHGGISWSEWCSCGARRSVNSTGGEGRTEYGPWRVDEQAVREAARQLIPELRTKLLRSKKDIKRRSLAR